MSVAHFVHRPHRSLRQRESLVLDNAQGTIIAVDHGCLWVTLERDTRDIILVKGMRFQIDRNGRTIVAAETDSALRLLAPVTLHQRLATWLSRAVARWQDRSAAQLARRAIPYF